MAVQMAECVHRDAPGHGDCEVESELFPSYQGRCQCTTNQATFPVFGAVPIPRGLLELIVRFRWRCARTAPAT
jgi:hypothetical protein